MALSVNEPVFWLNLFSHPAVIAGVILLLSAGAATLAVRLQFSRFRGAQQWRLLAAQRRLSTMQSMEPGPGLFRYVRKIDPFIFEEMLLFAFQTYGCEITRNARYTGDNGVDGQFEYKGRRYLIQAKNYAGYIRTSDIQSLGDQSHQNDAKGVFVHTGKTRRVAWSVASQRNVILISGNSVMGLLLGTSSIESLLGD